jgi:hypothetical protein
MAIHTRKIGCAILVVVAVLVVVWPVWTIVSIELRLWLNGKIAHELVQELGVQYPGVDFRGGASYKDERVVIVVFSRLDQADQDKVESWLRAVKRDRKIAPQIRLRFIPDQSFEDDIRID